MLHRLQQWREEATHCFQFLMHGWWCCCRCCCCCCWHWQCFATALCCVSPSKSKSGTLSDSQIAKSVLLNNADFNRERTNKRNVPNDADFNEVRMPEFGQEQQLSFEKSDEETKSKVGGLILFRVQDSFGGPSEEFPSNQDSGFHKTIPVRAKWFRTCDAHSSNSAKD